MMIAMSSLCVVLLGAAAVASLPQDDENAGEKGGQDEWTAARERMVSLQIAGRGITDERVLAAMRAAPRHAFVPGVYRSQAYADRPLPIGRGQTISQPYIVAFMTQLAELEPGEKVLEIGTGSGYQAAVLAELGCEVWSIEIDCVLAERARAALDAAGYRSVTARCGDGYAGWEEYAPFDAVIVTAAAPRIPEPLKEQLAPGGVMVIPVDAGPGYQELVVMKRTETGFDVRRAEWVRFVPMTGKVRDQKEQ